MSRTVEGKRRRGGCAVGYPALAVISALAVGCAQPEREPPRGIETTVKSARPDCVRTALLDWLLERRYTIRNASANEVVAGQRASDSRRGPPVIGGRLIGPSEDRLIFTTSPHPVAGAVGLKVTGAYVANLGTLFEQVTATRAPIGERDLDALRSAVETRCAGDGRS